jgi:hypothetical protein
MKADAKAAARRQQVEEDFDIAMAARRNDAMEVLAEQEATSKAEADRRVRDATTEANRRLREATERSSRLVAEAEARVDRLRMLRARISRQLLDVRSILAEATDTIEPPPEEHELGVPGAAADGHPMVVTEVQHDDGDETTDGMPQDHAHPVAVHRR